MVNKVESKMEETLLVPVKSLLSASSLVITLLGRPPPVGEGGKGWDSMKARREGRVQKYREQEGLKRHDQNNVGHNMISKLGLC